MENPNNLRTYQCAMCSYQCAVYHRLLQHYIRNHKQDPQFCVTCVQPGCGATFKKWKSFRQHVFRKHRLECHVNLNEVVQQIECENQDLINDETIEGKVKRESVVF